MFCRSSLNYEKCFELHGAECFQKEIFPFLNQGQVGLKNEPI